MIIDLERFIKRNQPHWQELETLLDRIDSPGAAITLDDARRLHYLYERCAADLGGLSTFSAETETRRYLSSLVARAYAEMYETRSRTSQFSFKRWLFATYPQTFRRRFNAFVLATVLTLAGCLFGVAAIAIDPGAKRVIMPFAALRDDPGKRVRQEESGTKNPLAGHYSTFSAQLMTHNTRVALLTLGLGITWGIGSALLLFYNGVILGAVAFDYVRAGYATFLAGWLMPHGVIEIPAILVGGQAAFVIASALIGYGDRTSRRDRLRAALHDVVTLACGAALMLIWAGIIESFVSQHHQPVIPYSVKIGFGALELLALCAYLGLAGRGRTA